MCENIVERGRPQKTIWRMRIACWIRKATLHTLRLCNTHCFSTATMVVRTHLNVKLQVRGLSCCLLGPVLSSALFLKLYQGVLVFVFFNNRTVHLEIIKVFFYEMMQRELP